MNQWRRFTDPDFGIAFNYPDPTPEGFEIKKLIRKTAEMIRVHLSSPGSSELYFELSNYLNGLDPRTGRQNLVNENKGRFDGFKAATLKEMVVASIPAQSFTFSWQKGARQVLFFDVDPVTYRVIFDPRSKLNYQILSTFELVR
jgi:hypothetical protein